MNLEAILFALLLAGAGVPLVKALRRGSIGIAGSCLLLGLVATPLATAWTVWKSKDVQRSLAVEHRPLEAPQDGYVSSQTCQACHPQPYATWHASYHRTMTQAATPQTVRGRFDGVELRDEDGLCRLERRGDEFWAEMPDPAWRGEGERRRVEKRIVMVTGSHHYQVYWISSGNKRVLWVFPFIYLIDEQRWIPRGAAFLGPEYKTKQILGVWNNSCIKCHSTRGRPHPDPQGGMDTKVAELGIACEACHGPAEEHVLAHRDPRRRYAFHMSDDEPDPSIVQPERLSHRASAQVCGQCHGVWRHEGAAGWNDWLDHGLRYRPGEELTDRVLVIRHGEAENLPRMRDFLRRTPSYKMERQFWSDGMVRVSGREYSGLIETGCFQRGELSCLSCHELHMDEDDSRPLDQWTDDQLAPGMHGDRACLQCHPSYEADVEKHTFHKPNSTGSECYNCHMPHTTYGLLKAIRSHLIDSPTVSSSLETGRPNACNQCHLDKTLGWSAKYLAEWYEQPVPTLTEDEQSIAASLLLLLRGDAGQRALTAWHMGWEPAREASGSDWMAPYLGQLLDDPYQAVRFIAHRSLRTLPGFEGLGYDFVDPPERRREAAWRAMQIWTAQQRTPSNPKDAAVLIDEQGALQRKTFARLVMQRDDREIELHE